MQTELISHPYVFGLLDAKTGDPLPIQDEYVEVEDGQEFDIYLENDAYNQSCSAEVRINGDKMGTWILYSRHTGVIKNPNPRYGTGRFKVVRKGTADWQAADMDSVAKDDQGVVTVIFTPGEDYNHTPPLTYNSYTRGVTKGEPQFGSRGGGDIGGGFATRGGSKGISSSSHENAGVGLSGESVQSFDRAEFTPTGKSTTLEIRLVLPKQVRPTGIRPTNRNRPPAL